MKLMLTFLHNKSIHIYCMHIADTRQISKAYLHTHACGRSITTRYDKRFASAGGNL